MKLFSLSLQQRLARWGMVLVVVMASTALTSQPAQASQSHPVENHCISPTTGVDLNVLFGTTKQIITPFCNQVDSGEQWTAAGPAWLVATSFDAVPEGFVPAGADLLLSERRQDLDRNHRCSPKRMARHAQYCQSVEHWDSCG